MGKGLRTLLRRNINRKSQTRLIGALNRQFAEMAQLSRFATAVVATYLATTRRLTVCNAGHPRPLWFRSKERRWELLTESAAIESGTPTNLPLGLDEETPYDQFSVALTVGDLVVFYTDALIEAMDRESRQLGEAGLLELARPARAAPRARSARRSSRPSPPTVPVAEADDDVTLLCLSHNGGPPHRLSIGEKVDVYAKVFGLKSV